MDQDNFKQTIINQYKEEIHELYLESEHGFEGKNFNYEEFNQKLARIWPAASADGLNENEFVEVVQECMPEHFEGIQFPFPKAA